MQVRTADPTDLDRLTALITEAFAADPCWTWAFPGGEGVEAWWRFLVRSALRYPTVYVADDFAAAAVWIPPGGVELTEEEEAQLEPLLRELLGPRAADVLAFMHAFEDAHPRSEPHWYLSLLGTASSSRGQGIGMALLGECLRRIDADGAPAYLESSNPVNDHRYEGVGFRRVGAFATPDGSHTLTTMWRAPAQG